MRPPLSDRLPDHAVGKVVDKDWSQTFTFETFPDCPHANAKEATDCIDCVHKLYEREIWLEQKIAELPTMTALDKDGIPQPVKKIHVVRGRYDDCIGINLET